MQTPTLSGSPLRFLLLVLAMFALGGASALAQTPAAPQPGPEYNKIAPLVGEWAYKGTGAATPFGPANQFKDRETDRLVLNGFFLETRRTDTDDAGKVAEGIVLRGFDTSRKVYVDASSDSEGNQAPGTTTVQGKVWTTVAPGGRSTVLKVESSADQGKTWMRWYDITFSKVGA